MRYWIAGPKGVEIVGVVSEVSGAYSGLERRRSKRSKAAVMEACSCRASSVAAARSESELVGVAGEGLEVECL